MCSTQYLILLFPVPSNSISIGYQCNIICYFPLYLLYYLLITYFLWLILFIHNMKNKDFSNTVNDQGHFRLNNYLLQPYQTSFYNRYSVFENIPQKNNETQSNNLLAFKQIQQKVASQDEQDEQESQPAYGLEQQFYLYETARLGSIYENLFDQFKLIAGSREYYRKYEIQYFINAFNQLSSIYGKISNKDSYIFNKIFGEKSSQNYVFYYNIFKKDLNLYEPYYQSNYQRQNENSYTKFIVEKYKHCFSERTEDLLNDQKLTPLVEKTCQKAENHDRIFLQVLIKNYEQLTKIKLKKINIQTGSCRLQPIISMVRNLYSIFNFSLVHPGKIKTAKLKQEQINKLSKNLSIISKKPESINSYVFYSQKKLLQKIHRFAKQNEMTNITVKQESANKLNLRLVLNLRELVEGIQRKRSAYPDLIILNTKIRFMSHICSQLIEYEMLTNKQYPRLHPLNVLFDPSTSRFNLSVHPIVVEALCNEKLTYSEQKFARNYYEEQNIYRDFSIQCNLKNQGIFLLLIHYFDKLQFRIKTKFKITEIQKPSQWLRVLFNIQKQEQNNPKSKDKIKNVNNFQKALQKFNKESDSSVFERPNKIRQEIQFKNAYQLFYLVKDNDCVRKLLLYFKDKDKLPSIISISRYLKLSVHVSNLSEKRPESVLWLRFKIITFLKQIYKKIEPFVKQHKQNLRKYEFLVQLIQISLALILAQFRSILRKEDSKMKQHLKNYWPLQIDLNLIGQGGELKSEQDNNIQDELYGEENEKCQEIGWQRVKNFSIILMQRLNYINKRFNKQDNNERHELELGQYAFKATMAFSKNLKLYLDLLTHKQIKSIINSIKAQKKSPKNINSILFKNLPNIHSILIQSLLKLDQKNILFIQFQIYRQLYRIIGNQQIEENKLKICIKNAQQGLKQIEEVPLDSIWWTHFWGDDQNFNVYDI